MQTDQPEHGVNQPNLSNFDHILESKNFLVLRINIHLIFLFRGPCETQVGLVLSLTYAFIFSRTGYNWTV
jgi:hypothetical protein